MQKSFFNEDYFTSDQKLLALSWKQPFANLMFHDKIETRTWNTNYRGWVLICSSIKEYSVAQVMNISGETQYNRISLALGINEVYCGYALGIGKLIDCRPMAQNDEDKCFVWFFPGLYCHIYEKVHAIEPFPWKGCQGWKEVSPEIKRLIRFK